MLASLQTLVSECRTSLCTKLYFSAVQVYIMEHRLLQGSFNCNHHWCCGSDDNRQSAHDEYYGRSGGYVYEIDIVVNLGIQMRRAGQKDRDRRRMKEINFLKQVTFN